MASMPTGSESSPRCVSSAAILALSKVIKWEVSDGQVARIRSLRRAMKGLVDDHTLIAIGEGLDRRARRADAGAHA